MSSKPYIRKPRTPLGIIKRLLWLPCDEPMSLWVETAAMSALRALWTAESPDFKALVDMVTGQSFYHHTQGAIKNVLGVDPAAEGPATAFAFHALGKLDLATFWLFLADVAKEGLYNWSSQMIRLGTQCDTGTRGAGHGEFFFGANHADGSWGVLDFSFPPNSPLYPASSSGLTLGPGDVGILAFHAQFTGGGGELVNAATRIINETTGAIYTANGNNQIEGQTSHTPTAFARVHHTGTNLIRISQQWSSNGPGGIGNQVFPVPEKTYGFMMKYHKGL